MADHAMARRALLQARDAVVRSEGKLARFKLQAGEMVERLVQTAEVNGTAFGVGVLSGRYGRQAEVANIPPGVLIGLVGHAAGYLKIAGAASKHLHNVADGALAAASADYGRQIGGDRAREAAGAALPAAATAARTAGYTDADIAAMAAQGFR